MSSADWSASEKDDMSSFLPQMSLIINLILNSGVDHHVRQKLFLSSAFFVFVLD